MAQGRKKGDHELKRVEIAEAACKTILKLGLERTGLADIARELGFSTGLMRHYFQSKEELLLYAKNQLFDGAYARAYSAGQLAEGVERLHVMAVELLPRDAEALDRWRLLATFNGRAIGDPDLMKRQHKRNARFWGLFAKEIELLQADGKLPADLDPNLEACGILAFIDGLADQVIMHPSTWPAQSLVTLMHRYIDSICRVEPAANPLRQKGKTLRGSNSSRDKSVQ